jgi:hypothetical protein
LENIIYAIRLINTIDDYNKFGGNLKNYKKIIPLVVLEEKKNYNLKKIIKIIKNNDGLENINYPILVKLLTNKGEIFFSEKNSEIVVKNVINIYYSLLKNSKLKNSLLGLHIKIKNKIIKSYIENINNDWKKNKNIIKLNTGIYRILKNKIFGLESTHTKKTEKTEKTKYINIKGVMCMDDY